MGKVKRFLVYIQVLGSHQWEEGVSDIQKACGTHLLESNQDRKELLRSNARIANHLEFITKLSGRNYLAKQIEAVLHCHEKYLTYLIQSQKEDSVE